MKKYLITLTFGPVQSFLAQARKTKDLWAGSDILSRICRETIAHALDNYQMKNHFPNMGTKPKSLPNRFSGIIETDNIQAAGQDLKNKLDQSFKNKAKTVLHNDQQQTPEFMRQIDNLLDIHWAAVEFNEAEDDFKTKFKQVNQLLAATKNARPFAQLNEKAGRKCALSGERNALYYRPNSKGKKPAFLSPTAVQKDEPGNLNPGEAIDVIGWIKRRWAGNCASAAFPSVAKIALGEALQNAKAKSSIAEFKEMFIQEHFDAQFLYEENLTDAILNRDQLLKHTFDQQRKEVRKARKRIEDALGAEGLFLQRHYALVMLDGDSMGKWVSGDFLSEDSAVTLQDYHAKIGEKMQQYITAVSDAFDDDKGKLVYCGGDDVLGFINLKYFAEVLQELREKFPEFADSGTARQSTASAGVVIAHYKTPLSVVLKEARAAEKRAKSVEDKDSLAITALKHSGEVEKLTVPWTKELADKSKPWITDIIDQIASRTATELISKNAQRNMLTILKNAQSGQEKLNGVLIKQAIERSVDLKTRKEPTSKTALNDLVKSYQNILDYVENDTQKFGLLLEIANYIGRKTSS